MFSLDQLIFEVFSTVFVQLIFYKKYDMQILTTRTSANLLDKCIALLEIDHISYKFNIDEAPKNI